MRSVKRVRLIFSGVLTMFFSLIFIIFPEDGYTVVTFLLSLSLIFSGLRSLIYYFTMGMHMVGGKALFYKGLIVLDLGMFTYMLVDVPLMYVIAYLLVVHIFSGFVDILRSLEAIKLHAPSWKLNMFTGVVNISIAVLAFIFGGMMRSMETVVYLYCFGLFYSGCMKIVSAFRKTAIVYIQ